MSNLKRCPACKESYEPTRDNFYVKTGSPDGLTTYCKDCSRKYSSEYAAKRRKIRERIANREIKSERTPKRLIKWIKIKQDGAAKVHVLLGSAMVLFGIWMGFYITWGLLPLLILYWLSVVYWFYLCF